nr:MAG TPA: hypothetical protein [Caudoviricetes sp.]
MLAILRHQISFFIFHLFSFFLPHKQNPMLFLTRGIFFIQTLVFLI